MGDFHFHQSNISTGYICLCSIMTSCSSGYMCSVQRCSFSSTFLHFHRCVPAAPLPTPSRQRSRVIYYDSLKLEKKFDKPEEPLKISHRSRKGATLSILTLFYCGPTMQSVAQVTALTGSVRTFSSGE